ncbi:MAG: hypothetical protein JXA71_13480 [Chitinispirillaceae bacterium]|nr:hypothetical protein [Chitinispirillaceae bacterium]
MPGVMKKVCAAAVTCLVAIGTIHSAPLTVLAPAAGDRISIGEYFNVSWRNDTAAPAAYVTIQLYRGSEYERTLVTGTVNDGVQSCMVPSGVDTAASYRVKVSYDGNFNAYNYSDTFTFKDSSGIAIIAPVSGDSLVAGSTSIARWTSYGGAGTTFTLQLLSGGTSVYTISSGFSGISGSNTYSWTVPSNLDTTKYYRLKVGSYNRPEVYGVSDSFRILDRWSISVSRPASTDTLSMGSYFSIQWSSLGNLGSYVKIELYRNGLVYSTINTSASNTGTYSWYVPTTLTAGGNYAIRLSSYYYPERAVMGAAFFIQSPPTIAVASPKAGEWINHGDSNFITWTNDGKVGNTVSIYLYSSGSLYRTLATSVANTGSFLWIASPTITESANYRIRVSDGTIYGESGIFGVGAPFTTVVTSPDSGTVLTPGQSVSIAWRTTYFTSGSYLEISLYRGDDYIGLLTGSVYNNNGQYYWTVPATYSTSANYRVLIMNSSNASQYAFSRPFTISNDPSIRITLPPPDTVIEQRSITTFSWTGNGPAGMVYISCSFNNGSTWSLIDSATDISGSKTLTTPSVSRSTPCLFRVYRQATPSVADTIRITLGIRPVLLSMGSMVVDPRPLFAWHPVKSDETYTIVIDTLPTFFSPIISEPVADTFYRPGFDLPAAMLYWRVVAQSQPQLPSLTGRFTIQDPRIPVPIGVEPDPTHERRPLIQWHQVKNASSYNIIIANNPSFLDAIIALPVTDTFMVPSVDLPVGILYWKVRSNLLAGYCPVQHFEVIADTLPILHAFKGITVSSSRPYFRWSNVPNAQYYRIEVYDSSGKLLQQPLLATNVADSSFQLSTGFAPGIYFWHVSSSLNLAAWSPWDSLRIAGTAIAGAERLPQKSGVWVNVSSGRLAVRYACRTSAPVSIAIYSIGGRRLLEHLDRQSAPGYYSWTPERTVLPAGTYIVRSRIDNNASVRTVVLAP